MRKISSALLLSYIALLLFPLTTHAVPMFSGGDGTSGDPYQITTCTELQAIGSNLDKDFILMNDIDCTASSAWNSGNGFLPIGTGGSNFVGTLDGNGHVIGNLTINRSGTAFLGVFGHIGTGAEIYDLGLINAYILDSGAYNGLLVGYMHDGAVSRVFTTGVTSVSGTSYNGGIIGLMTGGALTDAFSHAVISSAGYSGGVVGSFDGGTVDNVYATGAITANNKRGVVVDFGGTIANSFYDTTTTGASDDDGNGKPRSSAQMKAVATFTLTGSAGLTTPWDFAGNPNNDVANNDYWSIDPIQNGGYPYLTNVRLAADYPAVATTTTTATSFKTHPIQTTDGSPLTVFIDNSNAATVITDKNTVAITTNANPTTVLEYVIASNPDLLNAPRYLYQTPIAVPTSNEARTYFIRFYSTTNVPSELFKRTIVRAEILAITPTAPAQTEQPQPQPVIEQPAPTQTVTTTAPQKQLFTRDLRLGMRGEDVRTLQIFLNKKGFVITARGAGSPGNESTYFGAATRTALTKFQEANTESILRPFNLTRGTGLFLGNTRALIAGQQ